MATAKGQATDWQQGKSLSESLWYSLKENILCDVKFVVGETRKWISAHRLVLSMRSCVFLTMLTGLMSKQDEIVIPDIDADIFDQLLQFLYTDDVTIDGNNVIGLLYASHKYGVDILEKKCLTYMETSLTSQDVCLVMEQAHRYDKLKLKEKTLNYFFENGDECLKSFHFADLCHDCFMKVIESDELAVSEKSVFQAALSWSEAECRRQGSEITPDSRRSVLGKGVYEIRYPLLDQSYFDEKVLPVVAFTETEELKIMKHFLFPKKDVSPFKSNSRRNTQTGKSSPSHTSSRQHTTRTVISRFEKCERCGPYSGTTNHGIMFSTNEDVTLLGFQLYGFQLYGDGSSQQYAITASICDVTPDRVVSALPSKTVDVNTEVYDVNFPSPVHLTKDRRYNLIVRIEGWFGFRGRNGLSVVHHGSFSCSFFNCMQCKHWSGSVSGFYNTTVASGQIPGLIFLL